MQSYLFDIHQNEVEWNLGRIFVIIIWNYPNDVFAVFIVITVRQNTIKLLIIILLDIYFKYEVYLFISYFSGRQHTQDIKLNLNVLFVMHWKLLAMKYLAEINSLVKCYMILRKIQTIPILIFYTLKWIIFKMTL